MSHITHGHPIDIEAYQRILCKHHVLGSSLLLCQGDDFAAVHTSISHPAHHADSDTLFRVASITKMATALVVLRLMEDGAFGKSVGATLPAYPEEIKNTYSKKAFTVENAAIIPCRQVLGSYVVKFER